MLTSILLLIGGLLLLFIGGEALIRGGVALAKQLGLPPFVIGLTVVAYGTSAPELFISVESALIGHTDIALGNIIGSNIANILLVLGLTASICPVAIDEKLSKLDTLFLLGTTGLLAAFLWFDVLSVTAGLVFVVLLMIYTTLVLKQAKKTKDEVPLAQTAEIETQIKVNLSPKQSALVCLLGVVLLVIGGNLLITGAVSIATLLGLSQAVIGVTVVAFGGSVPELVTAIVAAYHRRADIVLGNIIGSNLFNIMGILGITCLFAPLPVAKKFVAFDMPILIMLTIALVLLINTQRKIYRIPGLIGVMGYLTYISNQFI